MKTMSKLNYLSIAIAVSLAISGIAVAGNSLLAIDVQGYGIWGSLNETPHHEVTPTFLSSRFKGEHQVGAIETQPFKILSPFIELKIRGWDTEAGGAGLCKVELIDIATGKTLLTAAPPQEDAAKLTVWNVRKFKGKNVKIIITDDNNQPGFAWIGIDSIVAGKTLDLDFNNTQEIFSMNAVGNELELVDFYGMPFKRLANSIVPTNDKVTLNINATIEKVCFLGMSNSIDQGCPVWAPIEYYSQRYFIGDQLGEIAVKYADGTSTKYPLVLGDSMWWGGQATGFPEPFASDEKAAALLANSLNLYPPMPNQTTMYMAYIAPENKKIASIDIVDFIEKDGVPVISAVTLEVNSSTNIPNSTPVEFNGKMRNDMAEFFTANSLEPEGIKNSTRNSRVKALQNLLYTTHENFPKSVEISKPKNYRGPEVSFEGNEFAQVLTNMFYHNLKDMDDRIDKTGFYHTSAKGATSWGSYFGFGQWKYGYNSYHLHTWARDMGRAVMELMALGMIDKGLLNADYAILQGRVWEEGLDIKGLQILDDNHPEGHPLAVGPITINGQPLPYHWNRISNIPNNHFGCFDNDSHGLTMMEMYNLWKRIPNKEEWIQPRWKYLVKAADWIQWQYENPEISEATEKNIRTDSESSGGEHGYSLYPDYTCMEGLLAFAKMADSIGDAQNAAKWRKYAKKLRDGMNEYIEENPEYGTTWTNKHSGWPHRTTVLAPIILACDIQGFTPDNMEQDLLPITINAYERILDNTRKYTPFCAYGAAMGYSQGFVTQAALLLDRMDEASEMLNWTARLTYYDAPIEKEKYLVPEGAEIIPTGEFWHRIGDLGNGVQQAETIKTMRLVMGVDNCGGDYQLRFIPRLPLDWTGIKIADHPVWIEDENTISQEVKIGYNLQRKGRGLVFTLTSDTALPKLELRLGALKKPDPAFGVLLDDEYISSTTTRSGDSYWVTCEIPAGKKDFTVEVR